MSINLADLDRKFAGLDDLPELLYAPVVTHPHGELLDRLHGIFQWRDALLAGQLPDHRQLIWPESTIGLTVLKRLEALDICQYCQSQEELTDRVLLDILEGIQTAEDYFKHKPGGFVDQLAQRQNIRDRDSDFEDPDGLTDHLPPSNGNSDASQASPSQASNTDPGGQTGQSHSQPTAPQVAQHSSPAIQLPTTPVEPDQIQTALEPLGTDEQSMDPSIDPAGFIPQEINDDLAAGQTSKVARQAHMVSTFLESRWQKLLQNWEELSSLFCEWGGLLGRGWDLTQGELVSDAWRDIIRYRKLLKQSPQLQALVAQLGRDHQHAGTEQHGHAERDHQNTMVSEPADMDELKIPKIAMETGGIERSDELSRMLPSEMALLGHPQLKKLWFARRAERMLLSYQYSGHQSETHQITETPEQTYSDNPSPCARGHGPILVCLDTSGSMHGQPEQIAKALVLEALRIAYLEQRPCYVFSFGGPEQILEHELDLTRGGLSQLLDFLKFSFHGGTDVTAPLLRALEKQKTAGWKSADILLVSDGRFPLKSEDVTRIQRLKKTQDLRILGLLLGNWKADAFRKICSPCHSFNDWGLLHL